MYICILYSVYYTRTVHHGRGYHRAWGLGGSSPHPFKKFIITTEPQFKPKSKYYVLFVFYLIINLQNVKKQIDARLPIS